MGVGRCLFQHLISSEKRQWATRLEAVGEVHEGDPPRLPQQVGGLPRHIVEVFGSRPHSVVRERSPEAR